MIRIVVADPSAPVRSLLRMRLELETDMSVMGECATLECARDQILAGSADVLVIDLGTDDATTDAAVLWLLDAVASCAIVVVSMDDRLRRFASTRVEFVSKYDDSAAVVDAVRRVHKRWPPTTVADSGSSTPP